ncbi:MAG: AsmA family protein [Bacteroidales bacterium]|nr:AsmA family protein [Bacteroidales bacterium]
MIKKILKISGISFLVLLILLIVLPFIFKDKILQFVKDEINNNLNAKVDFKDYSIGIFKTFPNLYVELDQLSVVGVNDFEGDTLAFLPEFTASLDIMSVFGDQIKIKSIKLDKPIVNLLVLKNGKANSDIAKETTDTTQTTDTTASHFAMALKKLELNEAIIKYNDESMNMKFYAQNLNFLLKGDLTDEHTTLKTETSIDSASFSFDGIEYLKKALVKINSDIDADLVNFTFTFSKNELSVNEFKILVDGKIAMPKDDIDIDLTYAAEKTDFKTLLSLVPAIYLNGFNDIKTTGNVKFDGKVKGIYNDKSMPGFNLNLHVDNGSFKYPSLPAAVNDIIINLVVDNKDGDPDHTIIDLKKFHMNMANNPFDAAVYVSTPISNANLKGILKGKLDLAQVQSFYPMQGVNMKGIADMDVVYETTMAQVEAEKYEEIKAVGYLKLQNFEYKANDLPYIVAIPDMQTEVSPTYFDLKNLLLQLGKSDLNLKGKVENFMAYLFKDQLLKGSFTLNSTVLNINQFLSSDESSTNTTPATTDTAAMEAPSIPKNIDFAFQANIKQLLYDNLELANTSGKIIMKEGILDLQSLRFNTLDGSIDMSAQYSYTNILPEVKMKMNLKEIDIKKTSDAFSMVKNMVPIAEKCNGKVSMGIDLQMNMSKTLDPVLNTVDAQGQLSTKSIVVENTELGKKIAAFLKNNQYEKIALDNLNVAFKIEKGNITIEPVKTKMGSIPIEFSGSQNIDQTLNYEMLMNVPKQALGNQANEIIGQWMGMASQNGVNLKTPDIIPIKGLIGGTLTKPDIKLNLKNMAQNTVETVKEAVTQKINEEVDKAKAEAIKKAQEQADKLYKEADAKATQLVNAAQNAANQINQTAKTTADQVRKEGYDKAAQLEKEAEGKGPIAKKLAKESADKLRKETDKKAADIENKAQQESLNKVNQAQTEANNIRNQAKQQGDKLIEEAKKK